MITEDTRVEKIFPEKVWARIRNNEYEVTVKYYSKDNICIGFHKTTETGFDFGFEIYVNENVTLIDIAYKILDDYNEYDPSCAAYEWLDDTGHGKCGAPYGKV